MKYDGPNGPQDYPPNFGEAATMLWQDIFRGLRECRPHSTSLPLHVESKAPSCPECRCNWGHEGWCSRR